MAGLLLTATGSPAQETSRPPERPVMTAIRTQDAPHIDGRADDPAWTEARVFDTFWQFRPNDGKPATERTEVRVLYDDDALYVSIVSLDSQPDHILRRLSRRDREVESDFVAIALDSYLDHKTTFIFKVNAAGVKSDYLGQNDSGDGDSNWDAIWDASVAARSDGWSAEFRIPFQSLRFNPADVQTWGVLVHRHQSRKAEDMMSTWIPRNANGFASLFGTLEGIKSIRPKKPLFITPYALAGVTYWPKDAEPAWKHAWTNEQRVGVDAQYGLSNNAILTMTVNPDFGQVEADQAELNLTAFETFFPEKRPFFLEGTEIFRAVGSGDGGDGPHTEVFYSRRIGRRPSGYGDYPDNFDTATGKIIKNPNATPILGALKLSGKTDKGWAYGALNAVTNETFKTLEEASGNEIRYQTAPLTNYSVARVQRALPGSGSYVGGLLTSTIRQGLGETDAFSGALDFRYNTRNYSIATEGLLLATRRLTPDGVEQGMKGQFYYGAYNNEKFIWQLGLNGSFKGVDANDLGFSMGDQDGFAFLWGQYRLLNPVKSIQAVRLNLVGWHSRLTNNFERLDSGFNLNPQIEWSNKWFTGGGVNYQTSGIDPYESRDHGNFRKPYALMTWFNVRSDDRKPYFFLFSPRFQSDGLGKQSWSLNWQHSLNLGSATQIEITPGFSLTQNETGFAGEDRYQGNDYAVFGQRNVDFWNLTLRGIHTFRPEMTFQVYGQYFWARGEYRNFQKLGTNGQLEALPKTFADDPNFNYSEVNLNAIARYEYRPGSVVFLVWTHNRSLDDNLNVGGGDFFHNTWKAPSTNVLLLKLSYMLGM